MPESSSRPSSTALNSAQTDLAPTVGLGPSDAELVALTLKGEEAAATQLVKRYETLLYSVALRRVGEPAVALDLVQDTFITAFTQLPNLRDVTVLRAWLLGILRNHWRNLSRSQKRAPQSLDSVMDAGFDPADQRPSQVGERLEAQE